MKVNATIDVESVSGCELPCRALRFLRGKSNANHHVLELVPLDCPSQVALLRLGDMEECLEHLIRPLIHTVNMDMLS